MPVDKPKAGESRDNYLNYCIPIEVEAGRGVEQAAAICNSYYDKDKMSKIKTTQSKVMARVAFDTKYKGIHLGQILPNGEYEFEDPCWDGYEQYGTKDMDGVEVPNCVPVGENMQEEGNINVFGLETEYFHMCPGAIQLFKHLTSMPMDEDTKGMVRSAALQADRVFNIEEDVIEDKIATDKDLMQVEQLVKDFKDLMAEIDEIVGMKHDVAFMDGHIEVIKSYM